MYNNKRQQLAIFVWNDSAEVVVGGLTSHRVLQVKSRGILIHVKIL